MTPTVSSNAVADRKPDRLISHDAGPNAHLFDTARFEQSQRIAIAMAHSNLLPAHLDGDKNAAAELRREQRIANCLRVVNQAVRWGMDPFAIMDETYVVRGKLGYQGKLVTAIVNARAGLCGRLAFTFAGKLGTDDYEVTVSGQFTNESEPRTVTLSVRQAKTDNQMWKSDPQQKLCYSGATKWARRHCPEILLGVVTEDDIERMTQQELAAAPRTVTDITRALTEVKDEPAPVNPDADDPPEMSEWAKGGERPEGR